MSDGAGWLSLICIAVGLCMTFHRHVGGPHRWSGPRPRAPHLAVRRRLDSLMTDPFPTAIDGPNPGEPLDDETRCDGEIVGRCDLALGRWIHECTLELEHDRLHECGCGAQWIDPNDDG